LDHIPGETRNASKIPKIMPGCEIHQPFLPINAQQTQSPILLLGHFVTLPTDATALATCSELFSPVELHPALQLLVISLRIIELESAIVGADLGMYLKDCSFGRPVRQYSLRIQLQSVKTRAPIRNAAMFLFGGEQGCALASPPRFHLHLSLNLWKLQVAIH
jgi:hypothetical protein